LKAAVRHGRGINPQVKPLETRALDASAQINAFWKLKLANCAQLSVVVTVVCIFHCCLQWPSGDKAQAIAA
jgi:hypothetical protein